MSSFEEGKDQGESCKLSNMAEYDLIPRMIPYLDRHLVFPLLEFLSLNNIYPEEDLLRAKFELLKETNMVDFISGLYKDINKTDEIPQEFTIKRQEVLQTLENLQTESQKVLDIIENPEVIAALRQDKLQNLHFLKEKYGLTEEMVNTLYQSGQFQYNCGNYGGAADMLYHYRVLSTDHEQNLSALWGKLASEILDMNWDNALEELQKLRETIDQKNFASALHQLQQRSWFIHWSIFVFFNHPKGRDGIIDVFFQPQYINTIQTSCPWILRYLTTAVVTNKRRKNILKDLVKIIQQESYEYRDPITEFIECLYVNFDFEGAQHKLKECEEVLANDFFLVATKLDFIEHARFLISETYCRIHLKIDISELSQTLNLEQEEGEKWIVNLIRDTRVDAKIDFKENTVIMNQNHTSIYQQVIERTKGLSFRSQVLASTIEKREAHNQNSNAIE
ncbi:10233_t:CDS:2 [Ambispora leptoticha]|uniref:Eukaryotic translation initiation factor 3 subunit E n=1 Tax=Ambispora leptoticha TaxID=144679 RepID=A0A9N8VXR8_9GLOM|nr:10233_t:CDS:2 [Ambispora leptoticha]